MLLDSTQVLHKGRRSTALQARRSDQTQDGSPRPPQPPIRVHTAPRCRKGELRCSLLRCIRRGALIWFRLQQEADELKEELERNREETEKELDEVWNEIGQSGRAKYGFSVVRRLQGHFGKIYSLMWGGGECHAMQGPLRWMQLQYLS